MTPLWAFSFGWVLGVTTIASVFAWARQDALAVMRQRLDLMERDNDSLRAKVAIYEASQGKIIITNEDAKLLRGMRIEAL